MWSNPINITVFDIPLQNGAVGEYADARQRVACVLSKIVAAQSGDFELVIDDRSSPLMVLGLGAGNATLMPHITGAGVTVTVLDGYGLLFYVLSPACGGNRMQILIYCPAGGVLIKLTEEEIKYLEEPYLPMAVLGHA
ncbi:hypothetical protein MSAN_00120200 [Mycena sanguinolenta]|uniref:Uncharacterized protein n=1 Tax=Mycena sanguinolenta TaxID=230812 RepID=A0A8H7DMW3_9AGAR|nr:hypothetical protein MSAN_00120200 [Mycena sanguinolenta]